MSLHVLRCGRETQRAGDRDRVARSAENFRAAQVLATACMFDARSPSMSSDGQAALATVLDFLFAANIEAADAFAAAKSLLEAGCTTREAIAALTPEPAKQLTPKSAIASCAAAMRKSALPTLDTPESPAPESKRQRAEAPPPPPPPPPADGADLPDIVINRRPS